MANFSSFFPVAAAGGGGFTKMKKYSTARATNDSTNKLNALRNNSGSLVTDGSAGTVFDLIYDQPAQSIAAAPSTYTIKNLRFDSSTALNVGAVIPANFFAGGTVRFAYSGVNNINLQQASTISSHPEFTYADSNSSLVLSYSTNPQGAYSANAISNLGTGDTIPLVTASTFTVNPSTDLGLSDGDSIGYFMVGGGFSAYLNSSDNNTGMPGGNILQGTAIISDASTDLTLSIGVGGNRSTPSESTISGGLTLTTADGSNIFGYGAELSRAGSYYRGQSSAGSGIMGYGVGGATSAGGGGNASADSHGWGSGGLRGGSNSQNNQAGDGAILLFY